MIARHRISDWNVLVIGIWDFDIVWNLSIVIWDFSAVFGKANRFYLNQLEADFDVSLHMHRNTLRWATGYAKIPGFENMGAHMA